MRKKLNILLLPAYTDQSIPIRTEIAEIFGKYLSKNHDIISVIKSKSNKKHFFWKNIEFYNFPFIKFFKNIKHLVKSHNFDIVYARDSLLLLLIGYIIKKIYKIRLIFNVVNPVKFFIELHYKWYHPKRLEGLITDAIIYKLMKKADLILPTSEWMGKYLISQGIASNKIFNFPNGANLDFFESMNLSNKEKKTAFIYIGTMAKVRKLEIIIKAMKIVTRTLKEANLIMVGNGDGLEHLKDLTKQLTLEKNIFFTGLVPYKEVPKYISDASVGLSPVPPIYMYKLSSPLKIFEYMGCSIPVIANKGIPSHAKTIKESKGGLLVDYTPEAFAKAMIDLYKNPNKAREMGGYGRKWIEDNRTYEKLAKDLEKRIMNLFFN